ncbi:MAG TPA: surface-adhesin E family protein [Candidatus Nitrosocosmicus sp.]|nr:surface-adhesin E family protein [Candidatus Nitrosocosmicus sp.]
MFTSNTLAQSRWSLVGMTPDSAVWLVDKATKKKASGVIQAWEKVVYQDGSYSIALNEWKCSEKMKRLIQVNNYYPNGDYLSRSLTPLPWRYIVPDSIEEKTFKIVCKVNKTAKRAKLSK